MFHQLYPLLLTDYLCELKQMHPIFTLWSTSEPELSPVLLSMAAAIERNTQAQQHVLVTFTPTIVQVSMFLCDFLTRVHVCKPTVK